MKKTLTLFLTAIITLSLSAQEKEVKPGWKLDGILPAVSFDSNLGFQYGVLFELMNHPDPVAISGSVRSYIYRSFALHERKRYLPDHV